MTEKTPVAIRKPYDIRTRVSVSFPNPTKAKQANKAECDINTIMAQYAKTGLISHVARYEGRYADVSTSVDYQQALGIVQAAQEMFLSLPALIRKEFDNDPERFLAFAEDPKNARALSEMGLAAPMPPEEVPPPVSEAPVPSPEAPAS